MKKSKILLATVVVTIVNIFIGAITCGNIFSWIYQIEPTNVWKPIAEISFPIMFITAFIMDLIFVYVYTLIKQSIPTQNNYIKGAIYGLIVCGIGLIPGMLSTYLYMTVATGVVIYWTIWGLIVNPIKGVIVAILCKE